MLYQKNTTANPVPHRVAWKTHPAFPLTASIKMLVTGDAETGGTMWRRGGRGADFYAKVLSKGPATVGAAVELGKAAGISAGQVQSFLRYLYTWGGQVEIGGQVYKATTQVAAPKQAKIKAAA